MNCKYSVEQKDYGPDPYVTSLGQMALQNQNFRTAIWTGCHLQMTLMSIPPWGEIGLEMHEDTDQLIRVEQGSAMVKMGTQKEQMEICKNVCRGDAVFVPAGTWHNIVNMGGSDLKVSSIYAPPKHPKGTVHRTRKEAEREEY